MLSPDSAEAVELGFIIIFQPKLAVNGQSLTKHIMIFSTTNLANVKVVTVANNLRIAHVLGIPRLRPSSVNAHTST